MNTCNQCGIMYDGTWCPVCMERDLFLKRETTQEHRRRLFEEVALKCIYHNVFNNTFCYDSCSAEQITNYIMSDADAFANKGKD